jgi:hypothetical protein
MSLHQRARDSGKCPPSLLSEERLLDDDGFEAAVLKVIDAKGKIIAVLLISGFLYVRVSQFIFPPDLHFLQVSACNQKQRLQVISGR